MKTIYICNAECEDSRYPYADPIEYDTLRANLAAFKPEYFI